MTQVFSSFSESKAKIEFHTKRLECKIVALSLRGNLNMKERTELFFIFSSPSVVILSGRRFSLSAPIVGNPDIGTAEQYSSLLGRVLAPITITTAAAPSDLHTYRALTLALSVSTTGRAAYRSRLLRPPVAPTAGTRTLYREREIRPPPQLTGSYQRRSQLSQGPVREKIVACHHLRPSDLARRRPPVASQPHHRSTAAAYRHGVPTTPQSPTHITQERHTETPPPALCRTHVK